MRISDWSSDVCSSDLEAPAKTSGEAAEPEAPSKPESAKSDAAKPDVAQPEAQPTTRTAETAAEVEPVEVAEQRDNITRGDVAKSGDAVPTPARRLDADGLMPDKVPYASPAVRLFARELGRSAEPTSELQPLMRNSYAV